MNRVKSVILTAILVLVMTGIHDVSATELGVNYYHESMMTGKWDKQYIPRSVEEVHQDYDDIKTISNNIKLYMNPFVDGNLEWVQLLIQEAEKKDFHIALTMMVDDRQLHDGNWPEYKSRVLSVCNAVNGQVDAFQVGNEIVLHSSWSKYEVKNRVVDLIEACEQKYSGPVGYQAFWYVKEAWYGTEYPIYFMFYENLDSFNANIDEFSNKFNMDNAYIGEFGEDLYDMGQYRDEQWQKDQLEKRWAKIQQSGVPIAYVFAHKEPSFSGFGIVRPDGKKRPAWEVFTKVQGEPKTPGEPKGPEPVSPQPDEPVQEDPQDYQTYLSSLHDICAIDGQVCSVSYDKSDERCRKIKYDDGRLVVQTCVDNGRVEVYTVNEPEVPFRVCVDEVCLHNGLGFGKMSLPDESSRDSDLTQMSLRCEAGGRQCISVRDDFDNNCRNAEWSTEGGTLKVQACQKETYAELYKVQEPDTEYTVCLDSACISHRNGYAKIK